MAIAEDASTPLPKTQTGTTNPVTAAFSPPANTLLVALVAVGWSTGGRAVTIAVSDSGGHTWVPEGLVQGTTTDGGGVEIFTTYLTSAPGSITVTATLTGVSGGSLLAVRVLTGAAPNQAAGAGAAKVTNPASTVGTISITTTVAGSQVYGISDDPTSAAALTPNGATSILTSGDFNDTTDSIRAVAWKATSVTGTPGATTLGGTWAAAAGSTIAAIEVLPFAAIPAAATLAATASLGAGGTRVQPSAATLAGTASFGAGPQLVETAAVTLAATSSLTSDGTRVQTAAATLAATSALTAAAGPPIKVGAVALTAVATLTSAGVAGPGVTLRGTATLTLAAFEAQAAAATLSATGAFGATAQLGAQASAVLAGQATLSARPTINAAAVLAASSDLGSTITVVAAAAVVLPAQSTLALTELQGVAAAAVLAATSAFGGGPFRLAAGTSALLSATATLRATATTSTPIPVSSPAGTIPMVSFWALNTDGTYLCALPDVVTWDLSPITGSPGAVTIDYPDTGRNFDVLRSCVTADRDLPIAIWIDGRDAGSLRALLNTSDGDDVADSAVWHFSGNFTAVRMEEGFVAPRTVVVSPPTGPAPTDDLAAARFYAQTAGSIMATLMNEARGRGSLTDLRWDFTPTLDSQGVAWSKTITLKLAPGLPYLKVLDSLVGALMCEWDIVGSTLVMWESGTRGVDRTLGPTPLILRAGGTIRDAPRKHSVRDAGTTLMVAGASGLYVTVEDPTAVARRGRRIERFDSQGSLTDQASLTAYGSAALSLVTTGVMEVSHGLALQPGDPQPLIDYGVGDWVYSDTGDGLERLRIKQLTVSGDPTGITSAGLTLNDLIGDSTEQLSRRIDGIVGGSTITGTSTAVVDQPDTMAPAAPQGVVVTSLAQPSADPTPRATVFVAWAPVITNADLTAIGDLSGYIAQYRYVNPPLPTGWAQPAGKVTTEAISWGSLIAGQAIEVRVAALDNSGNQSAWSASGFATTQTDATAPPTPSTPTVVESLGTLTLTWNGLGSAGEVMPPDFSLVEVHRSTTSSFTPTSATLVEQMVGAGARNFANLPFDVVQFFRLVARDLTGNPSGASAQASGTPGRVGLGDIAFANSGNFVEDGSFELATSRAQNTARSDAAWTFVTGGANHGDWFARGAATVGSGARLLVLSPQLPIVAADQLVYRFALRGIGVNGDITARIRWYLSDGTVSELLSTFTPAFATGAWTAQEIPTYIAPALTKAFDVVMELQTNATTGTWDVDRVEVRQMVSTLLIQDAAITNAKIANVDVGKLTAGTITAVMLMAGLIRSALTGLHYELDGNGLRFYDASGNVMINLNATTASAVLTGIVQTGLAGNRCMLDPGPPPRLRLFPTATGESYDLGAVSGTRPDGTTGAMLNLRALNAAGNLDGFAIDAWSSNVWIGHKDPATNNWAGPRIVLERTGLGGIYSTTVNPGFVQVSSAGQVAASNASGAQILINTDGSINIVGLNNSKLILGSDGSVLLGGPNNGYLTVNSGGVAQLVSGGTVKSFVIDHPTDPDRWLIHACTEAPHAGVEYWGTATIRDGTARVELPEYFEALTRPDGRVVVLTVVAEPDPPGGPVRRRTPATVEATVPAGGAFTIYSSADTGDVMWLVKAIRADVAFDVAPLRSSGDVHGDGPYRYYVPTESG